MLNTFEDGVVTLIKNQLGFPAVKLEIDDTVIKSFIHEAVSIISSKSNITKTKVIQANSCVDFPEGEVIRVYDNRPILNNGADSFFGFNSRVSKSSGDFDSLVIERATNNFQLEQRVVDFKYLEGKLYLYNFSGSVTVEYAPKTLSLEELGESERIWAKAYALALCKESIGRIRSKYKSSSSPFELDGDTMLSEAQDEKRELKDQLRDEGEGFFFVDTF